MVARATGLDAAGTCQSGADHAPDGSDVWRAQQWRGVDRFECELLIFGVDQRQHVGERRARLDGDDQLVRFIGRHRIQRRQIEQRIGRHWLADQPPGAMADDFQRLVAGNRRAHHLLDILGIAYFESVHPLRLAFLLRPRCDGRVCRSHPDPRPSF